MKLDNQTYEKLVEHNEKYIIKFSTKWCGPCKNYAPIFDEFSKNTEIKCFIVDCDKDLSMAGKFGVMTIPTTLLMMGSKKLRQKSGFLNLTELKNFANE